MAREAVPPPRTGLDPSHDVDAPPRVAQSNSLWPVVFGLVGALALGVMVFLRLDGNRATMETARLASEQATATAEARAACSLDHSVDAGDANKCCCQFETLGAA